MRRAHALAACSLRNLAWHHMKNIVSNWQMPRQRDGERERRGKAFRNIEEFEYAEYETCYCLMQKEKGGGGSEEKPWVSVCLAIGLHMSHILSQRQWLSAGSGRAVCMEVKGQLRGKGTPRHRGRKWGSKAMRMYLLYIYIYILLLNLIYFNFTILFSLLKQRMAFFQM